MRTNKTKGWQHIYPGPFRHHQYIFMYLHTYIFVLLWRGVFSVASLNGLSLAKRNTREREKKSFLFSTQWKLCFNKKKQIPIIFSRKLEGNNILYVDFLDSKLLKKKSCYRNCQKIHSLSLVSLSLFIN